MDGREMRSRGHNGGAVTQSLFAGSAGMADDRPLRRHISSVDWDEQRVVVVRGRDTFAARQTVHALAPLTTGCLFLQSKRR